MSESSGATTETGDAMGAACCCFVEGGGLCCSPRPPIHGRHWARASSNSVLVPPELAARWPNHGTLGKQKSVTSLSRFEGEANAARACASKSIVARDGRAATALAFAAAYAAAWALDAWIAAPTSRTKAGSASPPTKRAEFRDERGVSASGASSAPASSAIAHAAAISGCAREALRFRRAGAVTAGGEAEGELAAPPFAAATLLAAPISSCGFFSSHFCACVRTWTSVRPPTSSWMSFQSLPCCLKPTTKSACSSADHRPACDVGVEVG